MRLYKGLKFLNIESGTDKSVPTIFSSVCRHGFNRARLKSE